PDLGGLLIPRRGIGGDSGLEVRDHLGEVLPRVEDAHRAPAASEEVGERAADGSGTDDSDFWTHASRLYLPSTASAPCEPCPKRCRVRLPDGALRWHNVTMSANAGLKAVDSEIIALAEDEYAAAAETARIEVREIHTAAEAARASLLLDEVWNVDETGANVFEPSLIIAFAHAGNYVSAAYSIAEPDEMIGVTIGFFGQPLGTVMHSHIAGVRHEVIGRGAGSAMKLHQRLWCLNLGITEMTWTFDPLVARNAYFNFQRLGVGMVEYL